MITAHYKVVRENNNTCRPTVLDEHLIKFRRPRFDAIFDHLSCDDREHAAFENIITVNVAPGESFIIEQVCCKDFEEKIMNALYELCRHKR